MPTTINPKITDAGLAAAIAASGSGLQLSITHMALGSGHYDSSVTAAAQTALSSRKEKTTIAGGSVSGTGAFRVSALFPAFGGAPYAAGEIGFYAGDPDAGGVLFAVYSDTSTDIVARTSIDYAVNMALQLSRVPTGSITVTVDTSQAQALAAINNHVAAADPHTQYVKKAGSVMTGQLTLPGGGAGSQAITVAEAVALVQANVITSLGADKITAAGLAVGQYIQSTTYTAGSAGWRIHANGMAEFSGVVVRGTVYATAGSIGGNPVDSAGLQSATYTPGAAGWRLDSGGTIKAYSASGTKAFDLTATGTTPVLKIGSALEILGNGSATFSGALSAATGTFSGNISGATGEFAGTLRAGVVDLTSSLGQTTTYATPGTYTLTVPAGKTSMRVSLVGGGGGGGGGSSRGYQHVYMGGGGGGGAYVTALYSGLTSGQTYTLVVGSGGAAGGPSDGIYSTGTNGSSGGATYVNGVISASGGGGGFAAYPGGGSGGSAGGTGATAGQQGSVAFNGGNGGNSVWGVGGAGGLGDTSTPATSGSGFGSGGGGGGGNSANNSTGYIPAAGLGGKAIIEFFDPNGVVLRTEYSPLLAALVRQGIAIV